MPRNLKTLADRLSDRLEAVVEAIALEAIAHPKLPPLLRRRVSDAARHLLAITERAPKETA